MCLCWLCVFRFGAWKGNRDAFWTRLLVSGSAPEETAACYPHQLPQRGRERASPPVSRNVSTQSRSGCLPFIFSPYGKAKSSVAKGKLVKGPLRLRLIKIVLHFLFLLCGCCFFKHSPYLFSMEIVSAASQSLLPLPL